MSKLRVSNHRNRGNVWERVWNSLVGSRQDLLGTRKARRLVIDQLEERQLLTVSPLNINDVLINQVSTSNQTMISGNSLASDNDGDFVAVWTRTDNVLDANGEAVVDRLTGQTMTDDNIYARYYTDAVQRLTLPTEAVGGSFIMEYNGSAVQKLTFSATDEPFAGASPINGTFDLSFTNAFGTTFTTTVDFNELLANYDSVTGELAGNALAIQNAVRAWGTPEFANAEVVAVDADNYLINLNYGLDATGMAPDLLTAQNTKFTSGFLAAVEVAAVLTPGTTEIIMISETDPSVTAQNIEYAFLATATNTSIGPVGTTDTIRSAAPAVTVTARSATEFDITFTGDSGKTKQPLLVAKQVADATKTLLHLDTTLASPVAAGDGTLKVATAPQFATGGPFTIVVDGETMTVDACTSTLTAGISRNATTITVASADPFFFSTTDPFTIDIGGERMLVTGGFGTTTLTVTRGIDGTDAVAHSINSVVACTTWKVTRDPLTAVQHAAGLAVGYTAAWTTAPTEVKIKESSAEFRVNAPELENLTTTRVDRYNQNNAQVTMDADGDFVITWRGEVLNSSGTLDTEIFARRFSAAGSGTSTFTADMKQEITVGSTVVAVPGGDGVPETPIWGVRPLGSEFRVNSFTTNKQSNPSIGMDSDGNFTIAWESEGQTAGFFNSVQAQRYDRDGNRIGNEFRVNTSDDTTPHGSAYVSMSHDGLIAIAWEHQNSVKVQVYNKFSQSDASGNAVPLVSEFTVSQGSGASIDFDANDDFVVTWTSSDPNNTGGTSNGVYAQQYQLYNPTSHAFSFQVIRPTFRVNGNPILWPNDQSGGQVAMDADGEFVVAYSGYGPDMSPADVDRMIEQGYQGLPGLIDYTNLIRPTSYLSLPLGGVTTLTGNIGAAGLGATSLMADIDDKAVTFAVTAATAASFTAPVPFGIQVGDEHMMVTTVAGTTWTVTRGVDGTTPVAHTATSSVVGVIPVASTADFPLNGQFKVLVDSERILVWAATVNGITTWTVVTRGVDGTTAAAHNASSRVEGVVEVADRTQFPIYPNSTFTVVVDNEHMFVTIGTNGEWLVVRGADGTTITGHAKDTKVAADITKNILATASPIGTMEGQPSVTTTLTGVDILTNISAQATSILVETTGAVLVAGETLCIDSEYINVTAVTDITSSATAYLAPGYTKAYLCTVTRGYQNSTAAPHSTTATISLGVGVLGGVVTSYFLGFPTGADTTSPISASATKFVIVTVPALSVGDVVTVEGEQMRITSVSDYTSYASAAGYNLANYGANYLYEVRVTRGYNGTQAASHNVGSVATTYLSAQSGTATYTTTITGVTPNLAAGATSVLIATTSPLAAGTPITIDTEQMTVATVVDVTASAATYLPSGSTYLYLCTLASPTTTAHNSHAKVIANVSIDLAIGINAQIAAYRAQLEALGWIYRGEANGAMYSQYDADPRLSGGILSTDNVANSNRDGQNTSYLLQLDPNAVSGKFDVTLSTPGGQVTTTITPVYYPNGVINQAATLDVIHNTLTALPNVGVNWPELQGHGPIYVRQVPASELRDRLGTPWDTTQVGIATNMLVYEISFIGELHDTSIGFSWSGSDMKVAGGADAVAPVAALVANGKAGTNQHDTSIGMSPDGSFVMAWQEDAQDSTGTVSGSNFYFRTFEESVDTAGPTATDFLLPVTNLRLDDGDTVRQQLTNIVVTFDEDMMTTGPHSVTDPSNWALLKDGVLVTDGITHIDFGMNEGEAVGLLASNKWQAVLTLDCGDGYLTDGHYEIVAKTSLRDKGGADGGNALGRTGFAPDGVVFSRSFDVSIPLGTETVVNSDPAGDQYTNSSDEIQQISVTPLTSVGTPINGSFTVKLINPATGATVFTSASVLCVNRDVDFVRGKIQEKLVTAGYKGAVVSVASTATSYVFTVRFGGVDSAKDIPYRVSLTFSGTITEIAIADELQKGTAAPAPQATASNANGDYVTVWTSNTVGSEGVYAKRYTSQWDSNHQSTTTPSAEIFVMASTGMRTINGISFEYTEASHASVACDSAGNFVVTWSEKDADDWNIWACKYDVDGNVLIDPFRVNTTTENAQRYSNVGMDADGNFVITWQSYSTATGWDIHAQQYDAAAKVIGTDASGQPVTAGNTVGGQNETQLLTFYGEESATSTLTWTDGGTTTLTIEAIPYLGNNIAAVAKDIAWKLNNEIKNRFGLSADVVKTSVLGNTQILIEFVNALGNADQAQLGVAIVAGPSDAIGIQTSIQGRTGEFRVNDTAANNQMFPTIAMNANSAYVISWTSYGQDGDSQYQSNVYAKQYSASSAGGSAFDIDLQFSGGLTPSQQSIFALAAARWESIIIGDVADVLTASGLIDDIVIDASGVYIDGPGGTLAMAGPTGLRNGSYLPYAGIMQLDTADLASKEASGQLLDVITHEIGHVLGFGTIWTDLNLLSGYGGSDPQYTGAGAVAEYNKAFGLAATSVPVEATGGQGTAYSHWRESVFVNELMTGWLNPGVNYLSRMSAASMGDLGYQVNVNAASSYLQAGSSGSGEVLGMLDMLDTPRTYANAMATAGVGGSEMRVNQTIDGDQKWSAVGIDADGDFVITWTSFGQDGSGDGPGAGVNGLNGVYARRYNSSGSAASSEFLATTFTANDQQYSKVAMNAAGDFAIVWESYQDRPTGNNLPDSANSYGIYGQKYSKTGAKVESEFPVNVTKDLDQRYPSIAMDANGDFLVLWSGYGGVVNTQEVFMRRFDRSSDTAGPTVIGTTDVSANNPIAPQTVLEGTVIQSPVTTFDVVFSEAVAFDDTQIVSPGAVNNPANWTLTRNGVLISRGVKSITYDQLTHTATVTFDGDPNQSGDDALEAGTYVLTLSSQIQDVYGNALDGNVDGVPGGYFARTFVVDFAGSISGTVWSDLNKDTIRDPVDLGLANWIVTIDVPDVMHPTGDGIADYTTTTNPDGTYLFEGVQPGTYYVRQVLQTGWSEELPVVGFHEVTVGDAEEVTGVDFVDVDVMAPVVTVNNVIANKNAIEGNKVILTGTVSDRSPGSGLDKSKVWVEVAGQRLQATVVGTEWSVALPTALADKTHLIADGTYGVTVTAEDYAGNLGSDTTSGELIVDTVAPEVTVTKRVANLSRPTLVGTVTDPSPGTGIASVIVVVGTSTIVATVNGSTWSAAVPATLADGIYDVKVTATDIAGNIGFDVTTGELTVDAKKPVVTIDEVTTNSRTPTLTGMVMDPVFTSGIGSVIVRVSGQTLVATIDSFDTATGMGRWTLDMSVPQPNGMQPTALADGVYDVVATAADKAGNSSVDVTYGELTIDSTKPIVTVNPLRTKTTTPTLTGMVSDPAPSVGLLGVTVVVGGQTLTATVTGTTWSVTVPVALADNTYDVQATATDNAGNIVSDSSTNELTVDTVAPMVDVNVIAMPTYNTKPTLTGTVDDPTPSSGIASVIVVVGGQTLTAAVSGTTWSVTVPVALPDGTYDVDVTATDKVGNSTSVHKLNVVTVDISHPNDILLSNARVAEHQPANSVVGVLASVGPHAGTYTYAIEAGADSSLFRIVNNQLQTTAEFDYATGPHTYTIKITTTDSQNYSIVQAKEFTIEVVPVANTAAVGDQVWHDVNNDTLQTGEVGVAGAVVQIFCKPDAAVYGSGSDYFVGQTVTDANGKYQLDHLLSGLNYYLIYQMPTGYTFFSTPTGGKTDPFSFTDSQLDQPHDTYDAGVLYTSAEPAFGIGGTNDDYGQTIVVDAAGNFYVTGTFQGNDVDFDSSAREYYLSSNGSPNAFIAKYAPDGTLLWARSMGQNGESHGTGVAVGTDGSVYVTGGFSFAARFTSDTTSFDLLSAGGTDVFVAKLNAAGEFLWAKGMGGSGNDVASAIAIGPDGSICTIGSFQGSADFNPSNSAVSTLTGAGARNIFVSKLNAAGQFVWAKAMGGIAWEGGEGIGTGIAIADNGDIYTTGSFKGVADFNPGTGQYNLTSAGDGDVFVAKLDSAGNFGWARRMGGTGLDYASGIALGSDGSVHTTGSFSGVVDFDPGAATVNLGTAGSLGSFVSKLTADGSYVWARAISGTGWNGTSTTVGDRGAGIAVASDGSVFTTGGFWGVTDFNPGSGVFGLISAGQKDIFVSKLDSAGNFVTAVRMGGSGDDCGNGIALTPTGLVVTTGYFTGTADFPGRFGPMTLTSAGGRDAFGSVWLPSLAQGLVVSSPAVTVTEGNTAQFTVKLAAQPTFDVTVTIAKQLGGDADLSADLATLTFTSANWNIPQSVTLTAASDADMTAGTATFEVSVAGLASQTVVATEQDTSVQNLVVSSTAVTVPEGGTAPFAVNLSAQPTSDVTVTIAMEIGGDADLNASPTTLTFTSANWNVPQSVTLSAASDVDMINGTASFTVSSTGLTSQTVTATEQDTSVQNLVVSSAAVTVPEGGTAPFAVSLAAQPTSDVTVTIAMEIGGDADLNASPTTLTFTSANWNIPQSVTLSAASDVDITNGTASFTVSSTGLASQTVTATEQDATMQGLVVSSTAVIVPEGGTAEFAVSLSAQPTSNVTVTIAMEIGGDADLNASPTTLTFTSANWNIPQSVTLGAAHDVDMTNGTASFTVSSTGLASQTVIATEQDATMQGLVVSSTAVIVPEGGTAEFGVSLGVQPTSDVTVTIAKQSGDADLSADLATLIFTSTNWNVPQLVTLNAALDADMTNGTASFAVSSTGLASQTVTATEQDATMQGLVVSSTAVTVPEGGTAQFAVNLSVQPTSDVTVTIGKEIGGDADLNATPSTLTFTSANWNIPQSVTVNAASDGDMTSGTASFTVSSTGVTSQTVTATEQDVTVQSLVVSSMAVDVPEGGTAQFAVSLSVQPTSDVTVTIAKQSGDADLNATPATLTFTSANWNVPQSVTLSAASDADATNNLASFTVSSTGLTSQTVTATEQDDEVQGLVVSPTIATVLESGTAQFTVKLAAQPLSDVTVTIARQSGDADLTAGTATLTFTSANWNTAQSVTLSAAEDADATNGTASFVVSSTGLIDKAVAVTEQDDDVAGPKISGLMVVEVATLRDGILTQDEPLVMTWNANDPDGVASATLYVDGTPVTDIGGPYGTVGGVNFAATLGKLAAGTHTYSIVAKDNLGNATSSAYTGSFVVDASVAAAGQQGPKISGLMVVEVSTQRDGILRTNEPLVMTWNAVDPDGVASATLYVDGAPVTGIGGPYPTTSGANFAATLGALSAGHHTYSIVAKDSAGNATSSAYTGSFDVETALVTIVQQGPTVSGVMVVEEKLPRDGVLRTNEPIVMTWNVADPDGVAGTVLSVDGTVVTGVSGPYPTVPGVNYAASLGTLSAGNHTYSIVATDKAGNVTSTASSSFSVVAAGAVVQQGPTVSGVMVVEVNLPRDGVLRANEPLVMTWNAADPEGIAGATLSVDNVVISKVEGPYPSDSGANFAATVGTLAAGTHTYSIVATDKVGYATSPASTGTFTVGAISDGGFALTVDASMASQDEVATVTDAELQAIVAEAERRLTEATGLQVSEVMGDVTIQIADLPATMLGEATSSAIYIDRDAAGYGWFVDSTPTDDVEFSDLLDAHTVAARNGTAAAGRADLLTTVMHEMGHVLGYDHSDVDDLMGETLALGQRRTSVDGKSLAAMWDTGVGSDGATLLDEVFASFSEPEKKKWSLIG